MSMTRQEYEEKETMISRVVRHTLQDGYWTDSKHEMFIVPDTHDVKVRDCKTGLTVAFSSTKADFENSLVEFAEDYFA